MPGNKHRRLSKLLIPVLDYLVHDAARDWLQPEAGVARNGGRFPHFLEVNTQNGNADVTLAQLAAVDAVPPLQNIIGRSPAFMEMARLILKIGECDAPVLIEGETGTGKELAARAMHYLGLRRDLPFIAVNCGAIPDALVESELFGHHKGAFTDAKESRPGLITQAHGGTLFLDEIEALSPKGQVTLLRFLQDQQYRPLGSRSAEKADVRIIAATNVDLEDLVERGEFRQDLLFRLKILLLEMPPLRKRRGDVELLAQHFIRQFSVKYGKPAAALHPDTVTWMNNYAWPGNIRELENLIHREFLLADGQKISIKCKVRSAEQRKSLDRRLAQFVNCDFNTAKATAINDFEKKYLCNLLSLANGNVTLAARMAGKERRSLGKLLKKHGIVKSGQPARS